MLILCRQDITESQRWAVLDVAARAGFIAQVVGPRVIALFGDGDTRELSLLPCVAKIVDHEGELLFASRNGFRGTREVPAGPVTIGRGFTIIAGPCAVESREAILAAARTAKAAGVDLLRGGAYKPRTSPYSFQGLGRAGLGYLREAREETGLPVVTEVLDTDDIAAVAECADLLQVGTRNMANYALLKRVARAGRPVLLKRGMAATIAELLAAAEYLLVGGCPGVVLCERGIRTFSDETRFTLDLAAVPALRAATPWPVVVDPSHGTGIGAYVPALARAAAAAGAHGVMFEIHDHPEHALSDGQQAIAPEALPALVRDLRQIAGIARAAEGEKE